MFCIHFQKCTPLHAAAASGNVLVANTLIEVGADPDARNIFGNTPLHIACLNGHVNLCQELIYCKAAINAVNLKGQVIPVFILKLFDQLLGNVEFS